MNVINLATYPRSGNGYFRVVAYTCFGVPSASIYGENLLGEEGRYESIEAIPDTVKCALLKTHDMPKKDETPTIYVLRNPWACYCSLAHLLAKTLGGAWNDYIDAIIDGRHQNHYSTWSKHVIAWVEAGAHIVHYNNLITRPIRAVSNAIKRFYPDIAQLDVPVPQFDELHSKFPETYRNSNPYEWKDKLSASQIMRIAKNERETLSQVMIPGIDII